ncbi:MAG: competence/damage-inducible protein A [Firmicutes bacterium]|nr:competence/damage-inducible protein A [Bacillota bacterium]
MKAAILSVGTEILFGQIVNTNTVFLSKQLQELGVDLMYHMTVGDNPLRLKEHLAELYKDCDLILTTGGLGPTEDDLTKETIAEYFGTENKERPDQVEILMNRFKMMRREPSPNNIKQAYFPVGAEVLPNPNGTAPGFFLEKDGKMIFAMPGPPREMEPMFLNYVRPKLLDMQNAHLYYRIVRTYDIGESNLETVLLPLIDGQTDPTYATYCAAYESTLRVASKRPSMEEAVAAVEEGIEKVKELCGDHIYSTDNEELSHLVLRTLLERRITLSCAESMTAGGFSNAVTTYPGISEIFDRGLTTYSNRAKMDELGVSAESLEKYSAVSEEVAREMAEGLYKKTGSDICISVTGYAGPDGEEVGLYYVGLCVKGDTKVFKHRSRPQGREYIRNNAVREMFLDIYKTVIR